MGPSERMAAFVNGRNSSRAASGHHTAIGSKQLESATIFLEDDGCLPLQDSSAVYEFLWLFAEPFSINIFIICTEPSCRKNRIELGNFVSAATGGASGRH